MEAIILITTIIILILFLILMRDRSMLVQRFAVIEFFMVIFVIAGYLFVSSSISKAQIDACLSYYERSFETSTEFARNLDDITLDIEEEGETPWVTDMHEALANTLGRGHDDQAAYMNLLILQKDGSGYDTVYVEGNDYFATKGIYKKRFNKKVKEGFMTRNIVAYDSGHKTAVVLITDADSNVPSRMICVEISMDNLYAQKKAMEQTYLYFVFAVLLICSFLAFLIVFLQDLEWKKLVKAISGASSGQTNWQRPQVHNKEMQTLWNSYGELVKNIAKINYDKYRVFQAYYRFAPKQIEDILRKSSIIDVTNGDLVEIEGTLALVSLTGDESLRQKEFARELGSRYMMLSEHQKKQGGIVLSGNCDLRNLKYMFINGIGPAVRFGVDAISSFQTAGVYNKEDALMILHNSKLTYGILGDDEQATSYIVSADLDVLESYKERLRKAGVRMVVTDSMLDAIKDQYTYRYIGYIDENDSAFKLYEILDVYSEKERRVRVSASDKFKQALDMYYQDDFYLARNVFTDVLKECPDDGLAKWYMFACEYHLDHPELESDSYGLFAQNIKWR